MTDDLNIKNKDHEKGKTFNRKVNNIWLREETNKSINKFCQNLGLNIIEVDPAEESIDMVTESDMNAAGWYKKEKSIIINPYE